jgi:hypothetical protein
MKHERLTELFESWSESRLTVSEAAELSELLRTDTDARQSFRENAALHGELHAAINALNLDRAASSAVPLSFLTRPRALGIAAAFLAVGLTALSLSIGWLLATPADTARVRSLNLNGGGFESLSGSIPAGFPKTSFAWSGDPSAVAAADSVHPHALKFVAAAGEANIPNSPQQSCDIFQIIDLRSRKAELEAAREAFVELTASFLDARTQDGEPIRFICKVYVFEGSPSNLADSWPPTADQVIGSGARFHISNHGANPHWSTVTTRCVIPPSAGFLVVQIGAGSASRPGQQSPQLGEQYADDVNLTLHTRSNQNEFTTKR